MLFIVFVFIFSWTGCPVMSQAYAQQKSENSLRKWIRVDISEQTLFLFDGDSLIRKYPVSTSRYGTGNRMESLKTPLGWHRVRQKIGGGEPLGAIFVSRQSTGKQAAIFTDSTDVSEDLILTRILWLEGCEPGLNQGGNNDTGRRYIYIHGTQEEGLIGQPASRGCIRMRNRDIIDLFDRTPFHVLVKIDK